MKRFTGIFFLVLLILFNNTPYALADMPVGGFAGGGGGGNNLTSANAGANITITGTPSAPIITSSGGTATPGGSSGQTQYNNAGALGGYTPSGDATVVPSTGVFTVKGANGALYSGLATGILKNTTTTGVPSIAVSGTDYLAPLLTSAKIFVGNGSNIATGVSVSGDASTTNTGVFSIIGLNGTLLSGLATGILKNTTGTGVPSIAAANTDYLPVNNAAMTGVPTAPTAALATNTTQVATTAFVIANAASGGVTSNVSGTGITASPSTGASTISLNNTAVTAGTYTAANITVDAQGRITAAANGTGGGGGTVTSVGMTGDGVILTASVPGSPVTTAGTLAPTAANIAAHKYLGNNTGSTAAIAAQSIAAADLPTTVVETNQSNTYTTGTQDFTGATNALVSTQAASDNSTKSASTAYVTTAVANAIAAVNPAIAVTVATTTVLPNSPTYSNGVAGIGATLTAGSNTTLTVDGVTSPGSVLVKNQATAANNGLYNLTQTGSGSLPWILTRRLDYDQSSDINNTGAIPVVSGTANASTTWVETATVTTVGTDPLTFTQFSLAPNTVVNATGASTAANGNIPIGNGSGFTLAPITAGSNITVTNGAGSITIASTGGGSSFNGAPGGRLTLTTATPVTTADVTGATTLYYSPYLNDTSYTYSASKWAPYTFTEYSIAVPASLFRIYDAFDNGTGITLTAWDSGGQTTGTITGATAANPCVITATNTLSVGDYVGIAGVVGSLGTDSVKGLNGKVCRVSVASGSSFTVEGMDTSSLTYTSGGTFYKIPQSRTTAVTILQGHYADPSNRLFLGCIMTTGVSGQTEDSKLRRFIANFFGRVDRFLDATDTTTNWAYATTSWRPQNANTTAGVGRFEFLSLGEDALIANRFNMQSANGTSGNSVCWVGIGVDSNIAPQFKASNGVYTGSQIGTETVVGENLPALGYHFVQQTESGNTGLTFYGDNATAYSATNTIQGTGNTSAGSGHMNARIRM